MASRIKLFIHTLHAQSTFSFVKWTLITDSKIRGFKRICPDIRIHSSCLCVLNHTVLAYSHRYLSSIKKSPLHFLSSTLRNIQSLTSCISFSLGFPYSLIFILMSTRTQFSPLDKWDMSLALLLTNVCWVAVDESKGEWSRMIIKMSINLSSHMADVDT